MKSLILTIFAILMATGVSFQSKADTNMYPIKAADKAFFEQIQKAVSSNDVEWLSTAISYPFTFKQSSGDVTLKNGDEFKNNSAKILTAHFKSVVQNQSADSLFKNWQGVMIGKGAIWFAEVKEKGDKGEEWVYHIIGINP